MFAVTYQEEAVPKAFFVRLILRRVILAEKRVSAWYLESSRGPLEPETL